MFLTERDNCIEKVQICQKSGEVRRKSDSLFGHIFPLFWSIFTFLTHFSIFQVKLRKNRKMRRNKIKTPVEKAEVCVEIMREIRSKKLRNTSKKCTFLTYFLRFRRISIFFKQKNLILWRNASTKMSPMRLENA